MAYSVCGTCYEKAHDASVCEMKPLSAQCGEESICAACGGGHRSGHIVEAGKVCVVCGETMPTPEVLATR